MDICGKCMGTGVAGHPDSGYTCDCNGGMTDPTPTPTRAEVEAARFDPCPFGGAMTLDPSGDYVRYADYQALRERAEAAERDRLLMAQKYDEEHPDPALMAKIIMRNIENRFVIEDLQTALTAARRAEAAAWNDAIEAAALLVDDNMLCGYGDSNGDEVLLPRSNPGNKLGFGYSRAIRALRRAAPTEQRE